MRTKHKKALIYLILIVVICVAYFVSQHILDNQPSTTIYNISEQPTYQGNNIDNYIYNLDGNLIYRLLSHHVERFDSQGVTWFTQPILQVYDQQGHFSWLIQANKAKLTQEKVVYLYGNVIVNNQQPNVQINTIKTENAKINLTTQDISSDDRVTILGDNFSSTGLRMTGNLKSKTATLLEKVNTSYGHQN